MEGTHQSAVNKPADNILQLENNEDYLRDSLGEANQEREDLLERISLLQAKLKSQNEEIRYGSIKILVDSFEIRLTQIY